MAASEKQTTRVETYVFDENVKLTATVTYINNIPLVHTKTIAFDYNRHHFDMSDTKAPFYRVLVSDALRPFYVVELINYLSRIYNKSNEFDIYKTLRTDANVDDMNEYVFGDTYRSKTAYSNVTGRPVTVQNSVIDNSHDDIDKIASSNYINGLCAKRQFVTSELQKHINPAVPLVSKSFDDFKHVPIFGYVHPKLSINQGNTIAYMHLAIVVNILAHQPAFPLLNSQSAVAAFGSMMKAKQQNATVEKVTHRTLEEAERLVEQLLKENADLKLENSNLKRDNMTLNEKVDKLLRNDRKHRALIKEQNLMLADQSKVVIDVKEQADRLETLALEGIAKVDDLTIETKQLKVIDAARKADQISMIGELRSIANEVGELNASNHDATRTCNMRWILYISAEHPAPPDYVKGTPTNCIWIMSHVREDKNVRLPGDADILMDTGMVNRSIYENVMASLIPEPVEGEDENAVLERRPYVRLWRRHIMVRQDRAVQFLREVVSYLESQHIQPENKIRLLEARLQAKTAETTVQNEQREREEEERRWKQTVIDSPNRYIKHTTFHRRLYSMISGKLTTDLTPDSEWYVRKGRGGTEHVKLTYSFLSRSILYPDGDARITYEN